MPTFDLTDEELAAVVRAIRRVIDGGPYPLAPRLEPLRAALAKLHPAATPKRTPERPPLPEAPTRSRGGRRGRR